MQCVSCEFENMPGSSNCARCGTSLMLATAAVNVSPPRAGAWSRRLPQMWRLRCMWFQLTQALTAGPFAVAGHLGAADLHVATLARSIIPGWVQLRRRDVLRGRLFLSGYVVLLLLSLLFAGTVSGSTCLGLSFALHAASVADALITRFASLRERIMFTVLCSVFLFAALYYPMGWAAGQVTSPFRVVAPMPPFQVGDVLWYNRLGTPSTGDLVLYNVPRSRMQGRTARGNPAQFVVQGQRVNRLVAEAGQFVRWKDGQLLVDGTVCAWQPRSSVGFVDGAEFHVRPGYVFVLPDNLIPQGRVRARPWQSMLVPRSEISGTVFFRSLPWHRMSALQ